MLSVLTCILMWGIFRPHFVDGDDIKAELKHLFERGKTLWCDGKSTKPGMTAVVCVDSDSDDEPPTKKPKKTPSALESKTLRVDALANELKEKHGNKFNKIQCKLWAEALDVGRHKSKEEPPPHLGRSGEDKSLRRVVKEKYKP